MSHLTLRGSVRLIVASLIALVVAVPLALAASSDTPAQGPWTFAYSMPGTIPTVDYDTGGEGVAYHDFDAANLGGIYREPEGVDVRDGGAEGYVVANTRAGEWLEYQTDVVNAGLYDIGLRFATAGTGGTVHFELNGVKIGSSLTLKSTGSYKTYTTVWLRKVPVQPGYGQVLRLAIDSVNSNGELGNISKIYSEPVGPLPTPTTPKPTTPVPTTPKTTTPASTTPVVTTPKPTTPVPTTPKPTTPIPTTPDPTTPLPAWPAKWVAQKNAPIPRFEGMAITVGGKVYVFGGFGDKSFHVLRSYVSYDMATGTWKTLGTMPDGMAETHAGIATDGKSIYFAGGFGGDLHSDQSPSQWISRAVRKYDPATNAWSTIAWLPEARGAGALVVTGRQLHYFGGNPADRVTNLGTHYVYDLDTKVWSTAAPTPDPKDHFSVAQVGNEIYAIGGEHGHDQLHDQSKTVHAYDLTTGKWTQKASLPLTKSHTEGGTFVIGKTIYMAGGQLNDFHATSQVVAYDTTTDRWTKLPELPAVRQGAVIQNVGDQIVVALGAVFTDAPLATVWRGTLPAAG